MNHVAKTGGAEKSLLDMVAWLNGHGWNPSVVIPGEGELTSRLRMIGIPVHDLPMRRIRRQQIVSPLALAWSIMRLAPRLRMLVTQQKIALLHANSNTAQLYAIPVVRSRGLPVVWHCRDMVSLGPLGRWMVRHATRIIAISGTVATLLQKYGANEEKIRIVYNGIDTSRFVPRGRKLECRASLGLPAQSLVVAMVAQLVPWKNHALFLAAARRIAKAIPDTIFLVVGDDRFGDHPYYRTQLESIAHAAGIAERVIFTGYVEDMIALLEAVDILVHPAVNEPFGRCIVEAMSMGKPVVAVRTGGPAEILRDRLDGILVPPENADAIAEAVTRLAGDPKLTIAIGTRARERVQSEFDLNRQMRKIEAIYQECLGKQYGSRR
ncbi:MAG: glycosyltransferase family 4 protein [Kiritimatiellae bacterium]|nr:glycosyltransferase family 4 protein [Kiritimatiellia bacterium]